MENIGIMLYFWSIVDKISSALSLVITLMLVFTVAVFIAGVLSLTETTAAERVGLREYWKNFYKNYLPIKTLVVLMTISVLIPSKNDVLLILTANEVGKAVYESYNTEDGKLHKMSQLVDAKLDEVLQNMTEKLDKPKK